MKSYEFIWRIPLKKSNETHEKSYDFLWKHRKSYESINFLRCHWNSWTSWKYGILISFMCPFVILQCHLNSYKILRIPMRNSNHEIIRNQKEVTRFLKKSLGILWVLKFHMKSEKFLNFIKSISIFRIPLTSFEIIQLIMNSYEILQIPLTNSYEEIIRNPKETQIFLRNSWEILRIVKFITKSNEFLNLIQKIIGILWIPMSSFVFRCPIFV